MQKHDRIKGIELELDIPEHLEPTFKVRSEKKCVKCLKIKNMDEFYSSKRTHWDGKCTWCKTCHNFSKRKSDRVNNNKKKYNRFE